MRRIKVALSLATLVLAVALPPSAPAAPQSLRVRENVLDLSAKERRVFVKAVLKLKSAPSPYDEGLSYYDQFVVWHRSLSRCDPSDPLMRDAMMMGHGGPMFLPWHRQFLLLFEDALREVSGRKLTVPFWDWTDPRSTRAVFSDGFMGGDGDPNEGYAVTTGPFRKGRWELSVDPIGLEYSASASPYLTRHLGSFGALPTPQDVRFALDAPHYDVPPYDINSNPSESFRNALEGFRSFAAPVTSVVGAMICGPDGAVITPPHDLRLHNAVHAWVGGVLAPSAGTRLFGTMFLVPSSVNDPVFFLHHANIDRLWARWQRLHGVRTYRPLSGYPRNDVDDPMHPFHEIGIHSTPETVASIRQLGYRYRR